MKSSTAFMDPIGDGGASPAGRSLTRSFWRIDVTLENDVSQKFTSKVKPDLKKKVESDCKSDSIYRFTYGTIRDIRC